MVVEMRDKLQAFVTIGPHNWMNDLTEKAKELI
jgi:hypothetical protein